MVVHFGEFTLDTTRHELLHRRSDVHVSLKAYQLLSLLVERRPAALSKEEIHQYLWPETFVSESSLASLVSEIRNVLGEHHREGPFIRTIHGFGYAFAAEATEVAETHTPPVTEAPRTHPRWWLVVDHDVIRLEPGEHVVGRGATADIVLDRSSVSRRHARLTVTDGGVTIEDLGSRNGTYVRGVRIRAACQIEDGDELRLGSAVATFRSLVAPAETTTMDLEP